MDNKQPSDVPYVVYESAMTRAERNLKRLVILLMLTVVLMFLSNALWLYEWCQYDYVGEDTTTLYQQDGQGVNIIGDGNGASYGTNEKSDAPSEGQS